MNVSHSLPRLLVFAFTTVGILASVIFGALIGKADWLPLAMGLALCSVIFTVAVGQRHLVGMCLLIACLDFTIAPLGFKIGAMEQTGILTFLVWLSVFWRKQVIAAVPTACANYHVYKLFRMCVILMGCYAVLHFAFNGMFPYDEGAWGLNAASKVYAQVFGVFVMIVAILDSRIGVKRDGYKNKTLMGFIFISLLLAIVLRSVLFFRYGGSIADYQDEFSNRFEANSALNYALHIPIINLVDSPYTLRVLAPAACLVGSVFFFLPKGRYRPPILSLSLVACGILGSLLSGGRAALVFSLVFISVGALYSRRIMFVLASAAAAVLVFATVLVVPETMIESLPYYAQRSVGWLRPDVKSDAILGIKGSTDKRLDWLKYSWDYWSKGDARLLVTGRSVGSMDAQDVAGYLNYNDSVTMWFAIKRLSTHNGFMDLVIGFGLIGYFFVMLSSILLVGLLLHHQKASRNDPQVGAWSFIAAVFLMFWIAYTHFAGSNIWSLCIWFAIIALVQKPRDNQSSIKIEHAPVSPDLSGIRENTT